MDKLGNMQYTKTDLDTSNYKGKVGRKSITLCNEAGIPLL